jgi:phospholipid/cholesterol/gamma-HCH transport system substrate-binding protein
MQGAWKVGLLVLVFIGLLLGAYAVLGRLNAPRTNSYYVKFTDATGIVRGSPVFISGVRVGNVAEVELVPPSTAMARIEIDTSVAVPLGTQAVIPRGFISFGQGNLSLVPPERVEGFVPPNDPSVVLIGAQGNPINDLFPDTQETIAELNKTLIALRTVLENQQLQTDVKELLDTTTKTIDNYGRLANQLGGFVGSSQKQLDRILRTVDLTLIQVNRGIDNLNAILEDPTWQDEAKALLKELNATAAQANQLLGSISAYVDDPETKARLERTLANFETMSESGVRIASNAERIAENANEISADFKTFASEANELARRANVLTEEATELVRSVRGKVDDFEVPSFGSPRIRAGIDTQYDFENERVLSNMGFSLDFGRSRAYLGLYDAFESNRLIALYGTDVLNNLEANAGVFAGKPSIGVKWNVTPGFGLSGQLYGVNHPKFDARARLRLGRNLDAFAGVDSLFKYNYPVVGLGFRN